MLNTVATSLRLILGAGLLLLSTACVTQARYDEAIQELQYYQRSFHDLDSSVGTLQAQLAKSKAELALLREGGLVPVEAGFTGDIDERLEELRKIMSRLGSTPGDVEVLQVEGGYGLRLDDAILFESGKADLRPEGRALVLRLASEIRSNPFGRVEVRGHTDSIPVKKPETLQRFPHGNLQLSAARAIEVAALLTGEGQVDPKKVIVSGFGPSEPLAGNDTAEHRSRNRRVELFILD